MLTGGTNPFGSPQHEKHSNSSISSLSCHVCIGKHRVLRKTRALPGMQLTQSTAGSGGRNSQPRELRASNVQKMDVSIYLCITNTTANLRLDPAQFHNSLFHGIVTALGFLESHSVKNSMRYQNSPVHHQLNSDSCGTVL